MNSLVNPGIGSKLLLERVPLYQQTEESDFFTPIGTA
jgi:hypothetical protein